MIRLDDTNLTVTIEPSSDYDGITVRVSTVLPIDRADHVAAWGLKATHDKLAKRLKAAILAGKVFGPATVKVDVNGNTYLDAPTRVLGRTMSADLRRLGF